MLEYLLSGDLIYHTQYFFYKCHTLSGLWTFICHPLDLKFSSFAGQNIPLPDSSFKSPGRRCFLWDTFPDNTLRFLDHSPGSHNILHILHQVDVSVGLYHPHHSIHECWTTPESPFFSRHTAQARRFWKANACCVCGIGWGGWDLSTQTALGKHR